MLTKDGANTGNAALNPLAEELSLLSSIAFIRPSLDIAAPGFLLQYLLSSEGQQRLQDLMSGNAIRRLTLAKIKRFEIPVPPLPEQRMIAEILDTIDDAIQKTEAIIAKLEQVKQGLLHDLLTRGIDDNGELRDPDRHPEQFKDSPLGRIPKAWKVRRIPALFTTVRPGPRQDAESCALSGPVPVLDQSAFGFIGSFQGPAGVRASETNPVITFANHTCEVRWVTFDCSAIQNVFFLRPAGEGSARFLFYTIAGRIPQVSYQGHWPLLQELQIAVPNITEQQQIARRLSTLDDRTSLELRELGKLRSLKHGLMEDLLTGRVRVTPLLDETPA